MSAPDSPTAFRPKAQIVPLDGDHQYVCVLQCGHSRRLKASWTPVVESQNLGPYESLCVEGDGFQPIVAFVAVRPWDGE